jgi:phospholipid/cholesterol/gamma-HCH transport system substrate-binding protein
MNNRVNYTMVGGFVVLFVGLMIFFVIWLLQPTDKVQMKPYCIFFKDSVAGLNIDSAVKYRGFAVGKVTNISINQQKSDEIQVDISIKADTPIKTDTVANLAPQGITGLSFVDLVKGKDNSPLLTIDNDASPDSKIPVIPSMPSLISQLGKSVPLMVDKVNKMLEKIDNELLSDTNMKHLNETMANASAVSEQIKKMLDEKSVEAFHAIMATSSDTLEQLKGMIPKLEGLVENSIQMENETSSVMAQTFREMQVTLGNVNMMLKMYENSPSDFFFKEEAPKYGPGE